MKKGIVLLFLCYSFLANAQTDTAHGIRFEQGKSWQQVLAKAKAENKYVFVDCFTTWCAPCKKMEKEVYPLAKVGALYNGKFISVKMQMDTSARDNDAIKRQYADAAYIAKKYKVNAYPTYLFFTPDGKLLSRNSGATEADDFIALANDVTDPAKDYYAVLAKFRRGETGASQTSWLAERALLLGDTAGSNQIAKNYIGRLDKDSLFTKDNVGFMAQFTKSAEDKGFPLFYRNAEKVDSIMDDDTYAEGVVHSIIYQKLVVPELHKVKKTAGAPDWNAIHAMIQKKYNAYYAERVTIAARSSWGLNNNDMKEYTKYLVQFQDKFGSKTNSGGMASFLLNNYAWAIFLYSDNREELEHALVWSGRAVLMAPGSGWMDTYANILYKLGRTKEALNWEEIAVKLNPDNKGVQATLQKMKNNEPTWTGQ